jgi:hypothetical protein
MRNSPDESLYSISEEPGIEIDEESHALAGHTEIRQNLSFKYRVKSFHTFDFYDHFVLDEQVKAIFADLFLLIQNRINDLTLKVQAGTLKLNCRCRFVRSFEKTWAKMAMHLNSATNDCFRKFVNLVHLILSNGKDLQNPGDGSFGI